MNKIIKVVFISIILLLGISSSFNVVSAEDELPGMTHNQMPNKVLVQKLEENIIK